jgi:hypothetical protein
MGGGVMMAAVAVAVVLAQRQKDMADTQAFVHRWEFCPLCCGWMVVCGKCGNNCCNGGYGELPDGSPCDACPSAYDLQEQGHV